MKIPILADTNHAVSKAYGCLKEDEGIAFRGLYIIDRKGNFVQKPIIFVFYFQTVSWFVNCYFRVEMVFQ